MLRTRDRQLISLVLTASFLALYAAPALRFKEVYPDLAFLGVFFCFIKLDWKRGPVVALLLGLVMDLFSVRLFGLYTVSLGLLALTLSKLVPKMDRDFPPLVLLLGFITCFLFQIITALVGGFLRDQIFSTVGFVSVACLKSVYTIIFLPLVFYVFERVTGDSCRLRLARRIF